MGKQVEPDNVGGDWSCDNNSNHVGDDGKWSWMDSAASGTCNDSKQVGTRMLAGIQMDQHGQQKCKLANVPGPSTPSHNQTKCPTGQQNPPC